MFLDSFDKNKHGFDVEVVGWCETGIWHVRPSYRSEKTRQRIKKSLDV